MRKFVIVLFLGVSFAGNTQNLNNWQVGLNINPFIFTRFSPDFIPEKEDNNYPNGFGFGVTIEKNWNEHWGIKTGIEYTKQNEKYFVNDNSADNTYIDLSLEYYKSPLMIQYSNLLKENLYLTFNQGIQFSFLNYYKMVEAGDYQIRTFTSNYAEFIFYQNSNNNQYYSGKGIFYNETLFGIIGSVGLKYFISNKFSLSSNLRYEYDLSDADNTVYYKIENWRSVHNFRIGLELGLQYNFSLKGCGYCEGQKH